MGAASRPVNRLGTHGCESSGRAGTRRHSLHPPASFAKGISRRSRSDPFGRSLRELRDERELRYVRAQRITPEVLYYFILNSPSSPYVHLLPSLDNIYQGGYRENKFPCRVHNACSHRL